MKTYTIVETRKSNAQHIMNEMAAEGWDVVSVSYWSFWRVCLLITFAKEN